MGSAAVLTAKGGRTSCAAGRVYRYPSYFSLVSAVGSESLIKHARWVRKSIGGGLRQAGIVTAAARVAVDETFGLGPTGSGGILHHSHERARLIAEKWLSRGGKLEKPVDTNMVWLDLDVLGIPAEKFVSLGKDFGLKLFGGRLVVHYQISDEAITRLEGLMDRVFETTTRTTTTGERNAGRKRRKVYGI